MIISREASQQPFRPLGIVGNAPPMLSLYLTIRQIALSDATVLIRGEPGTGKRLVASAIHSTSRRAQGPFVEVHCATLGEDLLERKLFGYEEETLPGALPGRASCIQEAEGGTLFLDEIGALSPQSQVKLLRVLQEHEYERLGGSQPVRADVRVIAATSQELEAGADRGGFREDLYYRINVIPILLPPLRERRIDIVPLVAHFLAKYSQKLGKRVTQINPAAIDLLCSHRWPGNVRELESCIEYAILLTSDGVIRERDLPPTLRTPESPRTAEDSSLKTTVEQVQRDMITVALKHTDGNVTAAAEQLGITPRVLRYKIKRLGIACSLAQTSGRHG